MWLKKKPAEVGSDVEEILECIKGEIVGAKDREDDVLELTELVDDQELDDAAEFRESRVGIAARDAFSRKWRPQVLRTNANNGTSQSSDDLSGDHSRQSDLGGGNGALLERQNATRVGQEMHGAGPVSAGNPVGDYAAQMGRVSPYVLCNPEGLDGDISSSSMDKITPIDGRNVRTSARSSVFSLNDMKAQGDDNNLNPALSSSSVVASSELPYGVEDDKEVRNAPIGRAGAQNVENVSAVPTHGSANDTSSGDSKKVKPEPTGHPGFGKAGFETPAMSVADALGSANDASSGDSKKVKLGGVGVADDIEHVMHLIHSSDFTSVGGVFGEDIEESGGSTLPPKTNYKPMRDTVSDRSKTSSGPLNTTDGSKSEPGFSHDPLERFVKDAIETKMLNWLEKNHVLEDWMDQNLPALLNQWMEDNVELQDRINKHLSTTLRSVVEEKLSRILEKVG